MNIDNIDKAIAVMQRARNLSMIKWQDRRNTTRIIESEEELHACGNSACFAGYISVSHEFQLDGGGIDEINGAPKFRGRYGVSAIALWLDIPRSISELLVYGKPGVSCVHGEISEFYGKLFNHVVPQDIIQKLEQLKLGTLC